MSEYRRVDPAGMDWTASPAAGVWRKRLAHAGAAERGRVTSLVRFEPGARFPFHDHPEGEEFVVLDGEFRDENGRYPAGSYVFHPHGSTHAPFTETGCTLFVKLRHYPGERERIVLPPDRLEWVPGRAEGLTQAVVNRQAGFPELVRLVRFAPGTRVPHHAHPDGEEVLVLDGEIADENGRHPRHCWLHYPAGSAHAPWSETGCLLYVRGGGTSA